MKRDSIFFWSRNSSALAITKRLICAKLLISAKLVHSLIRYFFFIKLIRYSLNRFKHKQRENKEKEYGPFLQERWEFYWETPVVSHLLENSCGGGRDRGIADMKQSDGNF